MEQLTTDRLLLLRLEPAWMERFAVDSKQAGKELEAFLGYPESGRTEHPVTTYRYALSEISRNPDGAKWHCLWEILLPSEKRRIGGILFKGPPENGETEIGYGIDEAYRGKGYAPEAVTRAIRWAFENGAQTVIAKINPGNAASRRVLEKVGMREYRKIGKMPCFRINKSNQNQIKERIV